MTREELRNYAECLVTGGTTAEERLMWAKAYLELDAHAQRLEEKVQVVIDKLDDFAKSDTWFRCFVAKTLCHSK